VVEPPEAPHHLPDGGAGDENELAVEAHTPC
jgi:hypothetical protein